MQFKAVEFRDNATASYLVARSGDASPVVQQQLQIAGIALASEPLQ